MEQEQQKDEGQRQGQGQGQEPEQRQVAGTGQRQGGTDAQALVGPQGWESLLKDLREERERYKDFIRATEAHIAHLENEKAFWKAQAEHWKAQAEAAARQDALHRHGFMLGDVHSELSRERDKNERLSKECWDINMQLRETQVTLREALVDLRETKSQLEEAKAENQTLKGSEAVGSKRRKHPDCEPCHSVEARVHTTLPNQEEVQNGIKSCEGQHGSKAFELAKEFMEQLTSMEFSACEKDAAVYAVFFHQSTGFSFRLEEWDEPPNISGGQKVMRYKPVSLGSLKSRAPGWMQDVLLVDIEQLPMLLRRLLWVAGGRFFNQPLVL